MLKWLFQRVTGVVLFIGLIVHFYVMHYSGADNIGYQAVMARLSSPLWKGFDIIFLLSVIYHGFNGLWGICLEYIKREGYLNTVKTFLMVISFILFVKGVTIIL
ncbi:MAG: succinate dehydrogenase, hydrophobic membrane anchor protein [Nitrospirae bacterium]|nr:MAG: succinate dehydrogenase, hydrophobic membrane anchor protein [Nitrospirota bacterium]